ncbi:MAG: bidirectional hydrogenase complex protein HoxE [Anaerolineales bacterium]|jgi:bidirectional [NiFe] hydrogenase diaphorase subunit|nr:bidirectional hydrogenase complex protein HoxE [Anaerolineales bacterium]
MSDTESSNGKRNKVQVHPSGDERYLAIDRTMKRFHYEKDALLEVLHTAQETFGYLSEDLLFYISSHLNVSLSQVFGVATFYHNFTFEPQGKHNCIVCTGTACHVKGSAAIVEELSDGFNVLVGKTTEDGLFSLTTARCLGCCGLAPVAVINGDIQGKATPETVIQQVERILTDERVAQDQEEAG